MASNAAPASHGSDDGPGTQRTSPITLAWRLPVRSSMVQRGTATWAVAGDRPTWAGGSSASQWARWSCQVTDRPDPTRSQGSAAPSSTTTSPALALSRRSLVPASATSTLTPSSAGRMARTRVW